jgi:uncharacterized SAM-binding protein YcdF (DUF218 family)
MFFFLSKTLSYLTMPMVIIVACLVLSAIIRKPTWKKWLFRTGLGLLLFCSNGFIANEAIGAWETPGTPFNEIHKTYEWGILLTGVAKPETEPRDRVHFNRAVDRATHTVQLYKLGLIKKVLVSGGSGRLIDIGEHEADELAEALIMMGIPKEDIVTENKSRNTHDSAVEVKKILNGITTPDQCVLITSAFHMPRSLACFSKVGWKMDTFSAHIIYSKRSFSFDTLFIPNAEAIDLWRILIKEWVGIAAYKVAGYI